jgi:plastocyanin
VVVYLDPEDGSSATAAARAEVRQRDARFSPPFLAVAAGARVSMPNDDDIYHNVFSFSAPNEFDLGLYAAGEARAVTLRHAGVVKIYCSIHESMSGTIFVAPSPWFAVAGADGRFAIGEVPGGRFRLRTWAERLPPVERLVELGEGVTWVDVPLREAR